jgi:hypothetical protein
MSDEVRGHGGAGGPLGEGGSERSGWADKGNAEGATQVRPRRAGEQACKQQVTMDQVEDMSDEVKGVSVWQMQRTGDIACDLPCTSAALSLLRPCCGCC